ncbi:MAG: hypothetical protein HY962_00695 [Ignavibacteriae bacterium]|nr:hypothetical protein [Ignavibacteriota bacterium]
MQKYLLHEYSTVVLHHDSSVESLPDGHFDTIILDASRCPENIPGALRELAVRTACSRIILLRSMEAADGESLSLSEHPTVEISWTSKPIKLAELAELLRARA